LDGVEPLVRLLELEELDTDRYGAPSPAYTYRPNIFGGQVAAQAMRAAGLTVGPDRALHSLHGYFLRPGRPGDPVVMHVERIRDGRSFTTRRVLAHQHGEAIFILSASFHVDEPGAERAIPLSDVPMPGDLAPPDRSNMPIYDTAFEVRNVRPAEPMSAPDGPALTPTVSMWVRTRGPLDDDPMLHASVLTYISDMRSGMAALVAGQHLDRIMMTSLDHAMWFHRPIRADDWVLVDVRSVSTGGSRGLVLGTIHDRAGVHGVSFTQEVLSRELR
jgi:acyl-CoA thioesterase-2